MENQRRAPSMRTSIDKSYINPNEIKRIKEQRGNKCGKANEKRKVDAS